MGGMVRIWIIGIVVAAAFTLYSLVDAAMSDGRRARGVGKPIWVVLIVILPVIGGVMWFLIGKGAMPGPAAVAPDDDPRFTGNRVSQREVDQRLKDLEQQLAELDEETFPGEARPGQPGSAEPRPEENGAAASDPEDEPPAGGPQTR